MSIRAFTYMVTVLYKLLLSSEKLISFLAAAILQYKGIISTEVAHVFQGLYDISAINRVLKGDTWCRFYRRSKCTCVLLAVVWNRKVRDRVALSWRNVGAKFREKSVV